MRGLWTAIAGRFEAGEDNRGGGGVEYALMIALVAVVVTAGALRISPAGRSK